MCVTILNNERETMRTKTRDLVACIYIYIDVYVCVISRRKRREREEKNVALAQLNYFDDHHHNDTPRPSPLVEKRAKEEGE